MEAENFVFNNCGKRQKIEETGEVLPYVGITIFSEALIIESVDLRNLLTLVISSENSDSIWIPDLESHEKCDSLNRVISSVNVVSHK